MKVKLSFGHIAVILSFSKLILESARLISIESQPKKVVFIMVLVVAVFHVVDVIVVVEPRNIPLKFG